MGYKYKGNLAYGKNGTSWRFRDNVKPRFGNPSLRESKDLFAKDPERRSRNPQSTNNFNYRPNYIGWVEEKAPSQIPSRKAAQSTLTYDGKTRPGMVIDSKYEFDYLLSTGALKGIRIPSFYRQLKYPSKIEDLFPHNYMSSLIFRQEYEGVIKKSFDNTASNSQVENTGFHIDGTFQWGIPALLDPNLLLTYPIRFTHAVYANGGFDKTFKFNGTGMAFHVTPIGTFKRHPVNYNMRHPEGSSLSFLINQGLIKGTQREILYSGYRESRVSNSLGL